MLQFMVLFREEDGRTQTHSAEEIAAHQQKWQQWMAARQQEGALAGGRPLTLNGKVIRNGAITDGPHVTGVATIVGGYLLLNAASLEAAAAMLETCPVFEFGAFAEIREIG